MTTLDNYQTRLDEIPALGLSPAARSAAYSLLVHEIDGCAWTGAHAARARAMSTAARAQIDHDVDLLAGMGQLAAAGPLTCPRCRR